MPRQGMGTAGENFLGVTGRARGFQIALVAVLVLSAGLIPASGAAVNKSKNVTVVARFPYKGGTELAFDGKHVFAGQLDGHTGRSQAGFEKQGGMFVFDATGRPRKLGFMSCAGNDNDVAVIRPGLVVLGYHENKCGAGEGFVTVNTRNPARPKILDQAKTVASHTITRFPGKPLVYVNAGGISYGGGTESIVDISDPRKPKVIREWKPTPLGCHDVTFHITKKRKLGFCAGTEDIQIWDVSNSRKPETIAHIANPAIQFAHYALASPDGKLLVIDDEAFAAHECVTGNSLFGSLWFYDISDPTTPVPVGKFAPPRGREPVGQEVDGTSSWCTSHHYNFVPKTRKLVVSWFSGGTNVLDLKDPTRPKEIAHYQPADANAYTAHYFGGRIYVNDMHRGLEVLKVKGL